MDPFGLKLILITCLIFVPLERLLALHGEQKILRRAWANDVLFLLLNGIVIKLGLLGVTVAVLAATALVVPASLREAVAAWPLPIQIPLMVLLSDLGFYFAHRMFHAVPWLWRFHAVHHSIEELDWLAAARVHPLDQIVTKGISLIPVFAFGFSEAAIAIYAAFYYWQSILIHSNTRIRFGPLRFLLASPEFHHWHHSNDREARDRNFAGQLPFLDALFGSLHMPHGKTPKTYGLDEPMRQRYAAQIVDPFLRKRAVSVHAAAEPAGRPAGAAAASAAEPMVGHFK